jgi:hypothetical protein
MKGKFLEFLEANNLNPIEYWNKFSILHRKPMNDMERNKNITRDHSNT